MSDLVVSVTDADAKVIRDAIAERIGTVPVAAIARLITSEPEESVCIRCRVVLCDENSVQVGELTVTVEHSVNAQVVEGYGVPADQYATGGEN